MAYRPVEWTSDPDIPIEDLHPTVRDGLAYFERLFALTYEPPDEQNKRKKLVTWDEMRPRMIRVLHDLYDLEGPDKEKLCIWRSVRY